mmetsp:Transcript_4275/g.8650  ORF Transcript_4275/g.8650 Transcript_4275/m.8650 type:complete len:207 (-) Transcript_4275:103-723(-)
MARAAVELPKFDLSTSPRDAFKYHLVYHHSAEISNNHVIFLPIYIYSLFLLSLSVKGVHPLVTMSQVSLALAGYSCVIGRGLGVIFTVVCILPLGVAAIATTFVDRFWAGLGLMFFSLLNQVAGHKRFEVLQPTPNLLHGFVAAPVLEFISVWYRIFGGDGLVEKGLLSFDPTQAVKEAKEIRIDLIEMELQEIEKKRNMKAEKQQ